MRLLALIVATAVLAPRVWADDRDVARHEFSLAQDDDRAGRFEAAIGHYMRANELLPHPFNLYNIAVDYERLGNLRQAAEWYQRYLTAAPTSADHDRVARTLADLQSRPSQLSVRSLPDGAQVAIDGHPAGTTPLVTKLPGGGHHVAVDLAGQHAEKDVELGYGEPADVAFTLGGQAGTLTVGGTPLGAYVAVDNITIGVVPATTQISPGMHSVRVTASGYAPYEGTANVAANAETHVDAQLVPTVVPIAPSQPSTIALVLGAAGGTEVNSGDAVGLGMIGTRVLRYDLVFRIGRANAALTYDFMLRYAVLDGRVTPFAAIGYAVTSGTAGYIALVGVRWDVSRWDHGALSLVLDGGVRDVPITSTATTATTALVDPIELGLEASFK